MFCPDFFYFFSVWLYYLKSATNMGKGDFCRK